MSEEEINYWLEVFSKDNQAFMSKDGLIMPLFKVFEQLKEFQHENRQLKQELKLVEKISEFSMPDNMKYVLLCKPDYERNKYEYETLDKYKSVLDEIREWLEYKAEQLDTFDIPKRKETGAFWFATRGEIDSLLDKVKNENR